MTQIYNFTLIIMKMHVFRKILSGIVSIKKLTPPLVTVETTSVLEKETKSVEFQTEVFLLRQLVTGSENH